VSANDPTVEPIEPWSERSAALYELVFSVDDHGAQVAYVRDVITTHAPHATSLLDVACGTGWHLQRFARWYEVAGVDLSPAMLERARPRVPTARLELGDMRDFDLERTFDVVTCLSSSIAWLPDVEALDRAVATMARHLESGGVLIVEPWNDPTNEPAPPPWTRTVETEGVLVSLMETTVLIDGRWVEDTHYLVGSRDRVEHLVERVSFGAFTRADLRSAIERAGLRPEYDPVGPLGRGLWIGVSPRRRGS
jgi:SAM-dependent methyltransferase